MKSCTVLVILMPRGKVNRLHGRWQETRRLSDRAWVACRGESRLAMALEGGDLRVRPHETCQSRSVALGDVKRAKRRQKTRQIPR